MEVRVKLTDGATMPRYAKDGDAGMDLTSRSDVVVRPGETVIVGTGVSMEIPRGYVGLVFPRSGLGSRGLTLGNCVGVIDRSYRGEICAPLHNNHSKLDTFETVQRDGSVVTSHFVGDHDMEVHRGDRVCQILIMRVEEVDCVEVDELSDTDRGTGGFGSTGVG